jgi:glyoxylase-like metal-dependent hydrolase (beta-lactamase superfamily II)
MPWSIWLFHQITPIGILVNLVAVPVAFVNLALGFLAIFCAPFGPATPALNRANAWVAERLLDFVRGASEIPKGHWAVGTPFKTPPSLVVFDFGRGGAVLLRGRYKRWLLDCGSETDTRNTLVPAAHSYGIQTLDGLLLSHGNAAHIGGAITAQEAFNPKRIINSPLEDSSLSRRHILEWFAANHIPVQTTSAGDYLEASDTEALEVLYPPTELAAGVADDKGIVLRWTTPSWTILFTADAGLPTERWLLANSRERLHADVWVRGTHSREITGTDDFVRAVGARLIVVEGSRKDPRCEANRLWAVRQRQSGAVVWLQEACGAVEGWEGPERRFRTFLTGEELRWP